VRGEVKVQLGTIRRAWRDGGNHEFWMGLRTNSDDLGAFGEAIDRANRTEGPDGIFAQLETPVPNGFVVMASTGHDDDPANLDRWATELGVTLEDVGFTGTLQGVRPTYWPEWVAKKGVGLAAFFRWSVDLAAMTSTHRQGWRGGWHVPGEASARICAHHAAWTEPGGPAIIVGRDAFTFALRDGSRVAANLMAAVSGHRNGSVIRYVDAEETARTAKLGAAGETIVQIIDGRPDGWEHRIDELRRGLTGLPDILDVAFLRPTNRLASDWHALEIFQKLQGIEFGDVVFRGRHLLTRYVPDAHGIQVLREEHLAKARDLSDWTVTGLGHGRHLVEAHDLAAWYAMPLPEPDVVEQARHDFGDMILTKEVIAANPPPWTRPA
jgi:hypothetical protein